MKSSSSESVLSQNRSDLITQVSTNKRGVMTDLSEEKSSDRIKTPCCRLSSPPSHLHFIDSVLSMSTQPSTQSFSRYDLKDLQHGSRKYRQQKSIHWSSKEAQSPAELHPAALLNHPSTHWGLYVKSEGNYILSKSEWVLCPARQENLIQSGRSEWVSTVNLIQYNSFCQNWFIKAVCHSLSHSSKTDSLRQIDSIC